MFAKHGLQQRRGHLTRTFHENIEKEIRMALAKKYNDVRKTKDGNIRIGFDNMEHIDISVKEKQPE